MPNNRYRFCKGLGTTDALLYFFHTLQRALDGRCVVNLIHINFSACAEIHKVNHECLLFKFQSVGVSGAVFSVIHQLLSAHRQCVLVDSGISSFVDAFLRDVWLVHCCLFFTLVICFPL